MEKVNTHDKLTKIINGTKQLNICNGQNIIISTIQSVLI